jgi:hypothetical protein
MLPEIYSAISRPTMARGSLNTSGIDREQPFAKLSPRAVPPDQTATDDCRYLNKPAVMLQENIVRRKKRFR